MSRVSRSFLRSFAGFFGSEGATQATQTASGAFPSTALALSPAPLSGAPSGNLTFQVLQQLHTSSAAFGCQDKPAGITYPAAEVFIGQKAPDFTAPAVHNGEITTVKLADNKGKWTILFFYPKDFTYVCPTEIIAFNDRAKEFQAVNCELIAASCDSPEVHLAWIRTPRKKGGLGHMEIPIISDMTKEISAKYGVLLKDLGFPLRGLFIIDPEGVVQQITVNALPIGRSVDEALRLLQASQFYKEHGEVCAADWKPGQPSMVADPVGSLDYFSKVYDDDAAADDIAPKVRRVNTPDELRAAVAKGKVVVDFYAPWCGKCRQIGPHVEDLQSKYKGKIDFVKVDTTLDGMGTISEAMGVKVFPTFKLFNNGNEVGEQIVGYKKVPLSEAVEKLSKA